MWTLTLGSSWQLVFPLSLLPLAVSLLSLLLIRSAAYKIQRVHSQMISVDSSPSSRTSGEGAMSTLVLIRRNRG